jgi:hypothetical protein
MDTRSETIALVPLAGRAGSCSREISPLRNVLSNEGGEMY